MMRLAIYISIVLSAGLCMARNAAEYIIYPVRGISLEDSRKLEDLIKSLAVMHRVYASRRFVSERRRSEIPSYWGAVLSNDNYWKLQADPLIEEIFANEDQVEEFDTYETQYSAPEELRAVSQPPGAESIARYQNYVYRSNIQKEIFIYHVELGIFENHADFHNRPIEWLYTDRTFSQGLATRMESPFGRHPGHSTATASKATGNFNGASRLATLVVVKMRDLSPLSTAEVFSTIIDDITQKHRFGRSVVTVSWGSKAAVRPDGSLDPLVYWRRLREDIRELSYGAFVMFAAGNSARNLGRDNLKRTFVDTLPAHFVASSTMPQIFVVSNTDNLGLLWGSSQVIPVGAASRWNVFAPGVNVRCASLYSMTGTETKTGTSYSAPLAAGVLADAMATNQLQGGKQGTVLEYLHGWKRPGGRSVIWNHVSHYHNPPSPLTLNGSWFNWKSNDSVVVA